MVTFILYTAYLLSLFFDLGSCNLASNNQDLEEGYSYKMSAPRKVKQTVFSVEQGEGAGARVRRSIGRPELRNFDPFLMLDEGRVKRPAGFPDHPHRGFETVTYVLEGAIEHEGFCGHRGVIKQGDLQWMTAGRGIVHSEMPHGSSECLVTQLWVNLRSADKMTEPAYQELLSKDIPKPKKNGVQVAVISGEALGVKSQVYTRTPTLYLDFTLDAGAKHVQPVPEGWNAFIYTLSGTAHISGEKVEPHYTSVLSDGDSIEVENKNEKNPSVPADCWRTHQRTSSTTWSICDEHA